MSKNSTFENLVLEISSGERQSLLNKLTDSSEEINSFSGSVLDEKNEKEINLSEKLQTESFFTRLICKILSIFSGRSVEDVYSTQLVTSLGKSITKSYSNLLDLRRKTLSHLMYLELSGIYKASKFFQEVVAASLANRGGFYLVLGSVIMPKTHAKLLGELNPFAEHISSSVQQNANANDTKNSVLRKMERIFDSISDEEKAEMYFTIRASDWVRRFSRLPLESFLDKFTPLSDDELVCPVSSVTDLLSQCASVLCFSKPIKINLLEAFFFFNNKSRIENDICDTEHELPAFITQANENIFAIKSFIKKVPLLDLTRFGMQNVCFIPHSTENVEDWFVQYKAAWKKKFDALWQVWLRKKKQQEIISRMCDFLEMQNPPEIAYRPWKQIRDSLFFRHELTFTFIKGYFTSIYPQILFKPLKSVMGAGEFLRRENMQEFTDSYNVLAHMLENIDAFEKKLSDEGDYGAVFLQIKKDKLSTLSGKNRLDTLMLAVEAEGKALVSSVANAFRTTNSILEAIFARARTGEYQGLTNFNSIEGNANDSFRRKLSIAKDKISLGLDLIKDLETVELEIS